MNIYYSFVSIQFKNFPVLASIQTYAYEYSNAFGYEYFIFSNIKKQLKWYKLKFIKHNQNIV